MVETNGRIGVAVVTVAIAIAIMGGYVLSSVDADETTVTKYNWVADITGLFDFDNQPQFVEYDPSTNYTGYYTDSTTKYWDGVDYNTSSKVNNYKLKLAPSTSTPSNDKAMPTATEENYNVNIFYSASNPAVFIQPVKQIGLDDLLEEWDYIGSDATTTWSTITLSSIQNNNYQFTTENKSPDWVLFSLDSSWSGSSARSLRVVEYGAVNIENVTPMSNLPLTYANLSCVVDVATMTCTLYADNGQTVRTVSGISAEDVIVTWSSNATGNNLGDSLNVVAKVFPSSEYLDITKGVSTE